MSAREGQTPSTCGYPGCIGWDGECNETCDGGPPASPANPRPIEAREGQPPAPEALAQELRERVQQLASAFDSDKPLIGARIGVLLDSLLALVDGRDDYAGYGEIMEALTAERDAAVRDAATLREALTRITTLHCGLEPPYYPRAVYIAREALGYNVSAAFAEKPCPHARPSWRMCPHCLAAAAPADVSAGDA